jgi:hypothetical protein
VTLLLKDFGVKFSTQELDSEKFMSKLDKQAVVETKQKIRYLGDGSDYEAPIMINRGVATTPRKSAKKRYDEDELAKPVTAKKRKLNASRAVKTATAKKQAAKK